MFYWVIDKVEVKKKDKIWDRYERKWYLRKRLLFLFFPLFTKYTLMVDR